MQSVFRLAMDARRLGPALALAVLLSGCGSLVPVGQLGDGSAAATGDGGTVASQSAATGGSSVTWPFIELPDGRIISVLCH